MDFIAFAGPLAHLAYHVHKVAIKHQSITICKLLDLHYNISATCLANQVDLCTRAEL